MMTEAEIRETATEILGRVAPESRDLELKLDVPFREQFDFDSLDFLEFALALGKATGVQIPELDYPKLASLDGCVAYLTPRLAARAEA